MGREKPEAVARRQNSPLYRAKRLIASATRRCKNKHLAITIKAEDLLPALTRGTCEVTNIPFVLQFLQGTHPYSPTLDRIDPSKGYISGNVQVVIHMYNVCKSEWSHEAVMEFAQHLVNRADSGTISVGGGSKKFRFKA